ncbi:MAG TPA: hypothetical protein VKX17_08570 [Planctomycetota bacterium]|nr:hypothetical protein [Planctomycetota bacterium]
MSATTKNNLPAIAHPHAACRRARFQFHLSTAVALMFAAGGLMWANFRQTESTECIDDKSLNNVTTSYYRCFGWPFCATKICRIYIVEEDSIYADGVLANYFNGDGRAIVNYANAGIDAGVALLLLIVIGFVCERCIPVHRKKEPVL